MNFDVLVCSGFMSKLAMPDSCDDHLPSHFKKQLFSSKQMNAEATILNTPEHRKCTPI